MASNILTAVYGWPRIGPADKAVVTRISKHVEDISGAAIPGRFLVDVFPVLNYLPAWAAKWKRYGLDWHEAESRMFASFTKGVRDRMVDTRQTPQNSNRLICGLHARLRVKVQLALWEFYSRRWNVTAYSRRRWIGWPASCCTFTLVTG